ncbi:flagellar basal-body rod protein FlgG [Clostridium pasteurianum DSM 525 = ATCC 6013]|uniref:Flagellar basal-body rod protein FlgG n=1 Tax=Clostridium pasteurianum DSM 525 = ATCC 6013 TaxID=1262449 RepID=A0A0H3J4L8_CLOPA|nr:flagellar hook-basal body complex protein [Clostridium pasteurianum]AJA47907.1 flagellar basal-body rod protein FlgG [Clostridium pasteurianum DSM 525 = ATCC 6013]AJA51895.1 flagellar basal-body rod protein FlgG [Clostridium pasteurianum DSM 525 = ATCC 6013]AOZ75196.1 flagellar biosynthesis protein FlgG [Clostridium pasteurianum DSM 525 = ATCC 6013]AOZ78991.1 flagellar biosynthesis protein FlgG [Clostridium pasteurianum]ELP59810.1 flagellar basal body rod protein FlgG [Clostridium pasteuria
MIRSLYTTISGMITQQAKQDVITNNMSNANTVGFKGDNLAIRKFNDVLIQNQSKIYNGVNYTQTIGNLSFGSRIDETATDFTQGNIESTDSDTDFAIDGRGFFTVSRDNGTTAQNYYTRDGHFHVNMQGYLVNDSGDYVMGRNINSGNVERINVGNGKITSDIYGNINIDGTPAYAFQTVDFNNYNTLKKVGDNLYQGENPIANNNIFVKQKSLEESNINPVNEMVNMMSTMRTFETQQKIVQSIDQTLGQAIDVGTVR